MAFHDTAVGPALHGPFNWEYADQTARLAATGFTAADVTQRKLALQLSDKSQWILTNHSPIVWAQTGGTGTGSSVWGGITGDIEDQEDLVEALGGKLNTGSTTADIADSTDRHYVTDAQLEVLENTSGVNTNDQVADGITVEGSGSVEDPFRRKLTYADIVHGSTTVLKGCRMTIHEGSTGVDLTSGIIIVMNNTDPENPTLIQVPVTSHSNLIPTDLNTEVSRELGIDVNGDPVFSTLPDFTNAEHRHIAKLGWVDSIDKTTITGVRNMPIRQVQSVNVLHDLQLAMGRKNLSGNNYGPGVSGLKLGKSGGSTYAVLSNYEGEPNNPDVTENPTYTDADIYYYHRTGVGVWDDSASAVNAIDPEYYDNGTALAAVPTGKWQVQLISMYANPDTYADRVWHDIQYGQAYYDTMNDAIASISTVSIELDPYNFPDAYRCWLVIQQGTTDWSNAAKFKFLNGGAWGVIDAGSGGSGGGGGGGLGTVTDVSVATANGVSASVATSTTTPVITITLGAITPSTVNGLTLAAQTTGFTIAGGTTPKTLTVSDTASVSGTNTGDSAGHSGLVTTSTTVNGHALSGNISVTKSDVSLGNVTDDAQLKRAAGDFASFTAKTAPVYADLVLVEDSADSGAKKKSTIGQVLGALAWPVYVFTPNQLLSPNNSGWTVNALANLGLDGTNTAIPVRQFDDTAVEGVGFAVYLPAGATNMIFRWRGRAATAPATGKKVALGLYSKGMPDAAAVAAWSSITNIRDTIEIAANAYYLYDTSTISLSTLGLTADRLYLFEMVRVGSDATYDTLVGDWNLAHMEVTFN